MSEGRPSLPTRRGHHVPERLGATTAVANAAIGKVVGFGGGHEERCKYSSRTNRSDAILAAAGKFNPNTMERHFAHREGNKVRGPILRGAVFWLEQVRALRFGAEYADELWLVRGVASIERARDADVHRA